MMIPRLRFKSRLVPPGYKAWVIYPYMFFSQARTDVTDRLFRHEMEHVYQVRREGWFKFYIKYLWYSMRHGYWDNPYEVEARLAEEQPLNTVERYYKDHG